MIWDNLEDLNLIRKYLSIASSSASMLITTRYPEEAGYLRARGPLFNLKPFSPADSHALFMSLLGPEHLHQNDVDGQRAAEVLLQKMGGLAIGICTIAIRINIKGLSIQAFLKKYQKGRGQSDRPELDDYNLTLETLWNNSFTSLKKDQDAEEDLEGREGYRMLGILIFCSPDKIPKELFIAPQQDPAIEAPRFCFDDDELSPQAL
jgi:hypothetical protein